MSSIDQQFVEFIAKSLVSNPDSVLVERRIDERGVLLELTVAPEDLGRVIGKHGATAQSLRTLLRALGTKNDARYNLKIVDSDQPAEQQNSQSRDNGSIVDEHQDDTSVAPSPPPADDDYTSNDSHDESRDESSVASDDQSEDQQTPEPEAENSQPEAESNQNDYQNDSMVDKTRKELADLDDLDV